MKYNGEKISSYDKKLLTKILFCKYYGFVMAGLSLLIPVGKGHYTSLSSIPEYYFATLCVLTSLVFTRTVTMEVPLMQWIIGRTIFVIAYAFFHFANWIPLIILIVLEIAFYGTCLIIKDGLIYSEIPLDEDIDEYFNDSEIENS